MAGQLSRAEDTATVAPRVAFVAQPEYFRFMYHDLLTGMPDAQEFPARFGADVSFYRALIDFDADVNVFLRPETIPSAVLRRLRGRRVALSSEPFPRLVRGRWQSTPDSWRRYLAFRAIRHMEYDHVFHYDAASLPLMKGDGLIGVGAFAFPVATGLYRDLQVAPEFDVMFVGRSTPYREERLQRLKHELRFLHIAHGIWGPPLVPLVASSAISLNLHAEAEISWEPRLQMLLACGAFVISEPITPNPFLRPGVDFVVADGRRELEEAVRHYLPREDERRGMGAVARARVVELLDGTTCFARLFRTIVSGEAPRFQPGAGARAIDGLAGLQHRWRTIRRVLP